MEEEMRWRKGHFMSKADGKSQVRQCMGFCTADFWSPLAYESAEEKPKHCLTWYFLSALLMGREIAAWTEHNKMQCCTKYLSSRAINESRPAVAACFNYSRFPLNTGNGELHRELTLGKRNSTHGIAKREFFGSWKFVFIFESNFFSVGFSLSKWNLGICKFSCCLNTCAKIFLILILFISKNPKIYIVMIFEAVTSLRMCHIHFTRHLRQPFKVFVLEQEPKYEQTLIIVD